MTHKILIVDDDADIRDILSLLFEAHGFRTLQACEGQEAFELILEESPDLVISDLFMPITNGLELLRRLKETKNETPVFIHTGSIDYSSQTLENLGARQVFYKPCPLEHMLQAVRHFSPSL